MDNESGIIMDIPSPKEKQLLRKLKDSFLRDEMLTMLDNKNIPELKFILIKFNYYGEIIKTTSPPVNTSVFEPGEIGLVAFSLSNGVIDQYSTMIDPAHLSQIKHAKLQQRCGQVKDETLCKDMILTMPGYDKKYQDISKILNNVEEFVRKYSTEEAPLTLFCLEEELRSTIGCLIWLYDHGSKGDRQRRDTKREFSIKPLEQLVFSMCRFSFCNRPAPPKYKKDPREKARELLSKLKNDTGHKVPVSYQLEEQLDYVSDQHSVNMDGLIQEGKFHRLSDVKKYLTPFSKWIKLQVPCPFHDKFPNVEEENCALMEAVGLAKIVTESLGKLFDV